MSLGALPDELVAAVLACLPCIDLCQSAVRVCWRWNRIIHDPPALGRTLCAVDGGPANKTDADAAAYQVAARAGHVSCLARLAQSALHRWGDGACLAEAAERGHVACLRYAHENGCPWHDAVCEVAAAHGHVDCLRYAHEHGAKWRGYCDNAAAVGHLDVLRYAKEKGLTHDTLVGWEAAKKGHLDVLRYAVTNGWGVCVSAVDLAARHGHLDCLRYLHEAGGDGIIVTPCLGVAVDGRLDRYACGHRRPLGSNVTRMAARGGHLDCLRYAHEHGCLWYPSTCITAAKRGHLDCLRYAHENGCPWGTATCARLEAAGADPACVQYARDNGCPAD